MNPWPQATTSRGTGEGGPRSGRARTFPASAAAPRYIVGVVTIAHREERPGPGWHAHGSVRKNVQVLVAWKPVEVLLVKQRWLHVESGTTRHDRPVWDRPGCPYAMDIVVAVLTVWLNGALALRDLHWGWDELEPAPRTARRWAAHLRPHAAAWLHQARCYMLERVRPRALDEVLPAAGIPPPRGLRRRSQDAVPPACKLSDVVWLHEKVAHALSISLRTLLTGARWRWPVGRAQSPNV